MERDLDYYQRRFDDEMIAASTSASSAAEQCHRQLAFLYSRKLSALASPGAPARRTTARFASIDRAA